MLVAGVVVRWLELVVCDPEDTDILVVCPVLVVCVDTELAGRVVYTLLVPCEDIDDPTLVVVCPAAVLEVSIPWLVLVRSDEVDPGVVLIWLPLLLYVDEDKPGAVVGCSPLVVSPVLVRIVLVAVTNVAWVVSVV